MASAISAGGSPRLSGCRPLRSRRRRRGDSAADPRFLAASSVGHRRCAMKSAAAPRTTETVNIAALLVSMARTQPQTLAIAQPYGRDRHGRIRYRHYTYRELHAESDALARGFATIGIRRGVRTVLMVTPSLEFYALTFALFKLGAVIVLVDPGMGTKNLGVCLAEAEPEAFIGIPKAQLARLLFGWCRDSLRTCVTVGRRAGWG